MFNVFGGSGGLSHVDAARLRRVERKLDLLLAHCGIDSAEIGLPATVRELADRGEYIPAIKAYREATGYGLAEAKQAVDDYVGRRG